MAKDKADKVELHRDDYTLSEAAKRAECEVEDLLHMAAQGELRISINAKGWLIREIYQINQPEREMSSTDCDKLMRFLFNGDIEHFYPNGSDQPPKGSDQPPNAEAIEKVMAPLTPRIKPVTDFIRPIIDRIEWFGSRYDMSIFRTERVSASSFANFFTDPNAATVTLDMSHWAPLDSDEGELELCIHTEPEILVKDAFAADKLVVMQKDLAVLIAKASPPQPIDEVQPTIVLPESVELLVAEAVRKDKSDQARKAAEKKNSSKWGGLREIVLGKYKAGHWKSVAAASREIYSELGIRQQLLAETNALRTIAEWISDYKKGQAQE